MKKVLFASLFAACAAMGLSSCMNGDYDATPNANNSAPNPLANTGGSGGGGGTSGGGGNFNWTGTDPMSAKIDGTSYTATGVTFSSITSGPLPYEGITGMINGGTLLVGWPVNAAPGTYTSNTTGTAIVYNIDENGTNWGYASNIFGGTGQIQIIENDATHVKGRFYGTLKSSGSGTHTMTEGWFNVTK